MKILTIAMLIVFLVSSLVAGGLYWTFNFGDCKDGCAEGMVFIFFLPALVIAGISGLAVVGLQVATWRNRQKKL